MGCTFPFWLHIDIFPLFFFLSNFSYPTAALPPVCLTSRCILAFSASSRPSPWPTRPNWLFWHCSTGNALQPSTNQSLTFLRYIRYMRYGLRSGLVCIWISMCHIRVYCIGRMAPIYFWRGNELLLLLFYNVLHLLIASQTIAYSIPWGCIY